MRNGTLYLLPPLVHLTSAIVSGSSQLLPTPAAFDANAMGSPESINARRQRMKEKHRNGNGFGLNLSQWASLQSQSLLPTPQAEDWRTCADYSDGSRGHSPQFRHLGSGRLNPRFVEWMMGFPPGWTDVDSLD